MKLSIKKEQLVAVVDHVTKAVASKTTLLALTTIKIVTEADKVTLTGSNADISIVGTIPAVQGEKTVATIEETGAVCLSAKYFVEIIKKLPTEDIKIEVGDNFTTLISANGSNFTLNGLDAEEYPKLPEVKEGIQLKVAAGALKEMIKKSIFAVSTNESRPILQGANWIIKEGTLTNTVTDSHRLVKLPLEVGGDSTEERVMNIPGSSLKELMKVLVEDESEIVIVITNNQILFQLDNLLFYSRLLEGTFPDTSKLIPNEAKTTVTVNINKLKGALERASLLARDTKNNVVNIETLEKNIIRISSNNPEVGKIEEELECGAIEGEQINITVNAKYVNDTLNALDGKEALFKFTGAMSPFLINEKGNDQLLHLILPVRTY